MRAIVLALTLCGVAAFAPHRSPPRSLSVPRSKKLPRSAPLVVASTAAAAPCDVPDAEAVGVTGATLRGLSLTNAKGEKQTLGSAMGEGQSVVCFLRHLGWPYCWSYAANWCEKLDQLDAKGASLSFISIGDAEKLNKFLDLNPAVPRDRAFVDDYSFAAYEAAGFGVPGDDEEATKQAAKEVNFNPGLGPRQWWNYLTSTASLAPIPDDMKFGEIPQGVLRLGGTFVVDANDEVLFAHADRLPGDHPEVDTVLAKLA